jgi:hypothetical protein
MVCIHSILEEHRCVTDLSDAMATNVGMPFQFLSQRYADIWPLPPRLLVRPRRRSITLTLWSIGDRSIAAHPGAKIAISIRQIAIFRGIARENASQSELPFPSASLLFSTRWMRLHQPPAGDFLGSPYCIAIRGVAIIYSIRPSFSCDYRLIERGKELTNDCPVRMEAPQSVISQNVNTLCNHCTTLF